MSRLALIGLMVVGMSGAVLAQGAPPTLPGMPAGCGMVSGDFEITEATDLAITGSLTGDVEGALAGTVTNSNMISMGIVTIFVARFSGTVTNAEGTYEVVGRYISVALTPPMGGPPIPLGSIEGLKLLITGGTGAAEGSMGVLTGFHSEQMNLPAGFPSGYHGVVCTPEPATTP